jgi:hypothetical protein
VDDHEGTLLFQVDAFAATVACVDDGVLEIAGPGLGLHLLMVKDVCLSLDEITMMERFGKVRCLRL